MTKEDKRLLLIDLCARLPYGVKINIKSDYTREMEDTELTPYHLDGLGYNAEYRDLRPYLRPISSMMQGEWEEMTSLIYPHGRVNCNPDNKNELLLWLSAEGNEMPIILMNNVFSWLNKHHFDYRGLIEKGLALEAKEGMYKTE